MLRDLHELTDADADEDPLLLLGCGHVLTRSTLDGLVALTDFYGQSPDGTWSHVKSVPEGETQCPSCPSCRAPLVGVLRTGRVLKKAALDLVDRKHLTEWV